MGVGGQRGSPPVVSLSETLTHTAGGNTGTSHFPVCARSVMSYSATPWTVAHQASLSMGFSRKEYFQARTPPGDLPDPGIEPAFNTPTLPGGFFTTSTTWEAYCANKEYKGFPGGSDGKEPASNEGNSDSILGSGKFPGDGNGYPLLYSCLENSVHRGAR